MNHPEIINLPRLIFTISLVVKKKKKKEKKRKKKRKKKGKKRSKEIDIRILHRKTNLIEGTRLLSQSFRKH